MMRSKVNLRPILVVLVLVVFYLVVNYFVPYDSTDNKSDNDRSGMKLYTDHLTKCQYLAAGNFFGANGITPRLDANGNHLCRVE